MRSALAYLKAMLFGSKTTDRTIRAVSNKPKTVNLISPPVQQHTVKKTPYYSQHSLNKPSLSLTLSAQAFIKIQWMTHHSDVEVGMWGIAASNEPLYIEDFQVVEQRSNRVHNQFDDDALTAFDEFWAFEEGRPRNEFRLVWAHTHPKGCSATPSGVDEKTFTDPERLGAFHQVIMLIMSEDGSISCRFRQIDPIAFEQEIPVYVDWASIKEAVLDVSAWLEEYDATVKPKLITNSYSAYYYGHYNADNGYGLFDNETEEKRWEDYWGVHPNSTSRHNVTADKVKEAVQTRIAAREADKANTESTKESRVSTEGGTSESVRNRHGFHGNADVQGLKRGNGRVTGNQTKEIQLASNTNKPQNTSGIRLAGEEKTTSSSTEMSIESVLDCLSEEEIQSIIDDDVCDETIEFDSSDFNDIAQDCSADPTTGLAMDPQLADGELYEHSTHELDDIIIDDYRKYFDPDHAPDNPALPIDFERGEYVTEPDTCNGVVNHWVWYDNEAIEDKFGVDIYRLADLYAKIQLVCGSHRKACWALMELVNSHYKSFLKTVVLASINERLLSDLIGDDFIDCDETIEREYMFRLEADADSVFNYSNNALFNENGCRNCFNCTVGKMNELYLDLRIAGYNRAEALQKLHDFKRLGYNLNSLTLGYIDQSVIEDMTDPEWVAEWRLTTDVNEPAEADEDVGTELIGAV